MNGSHLITNSLVRTDIFVQEGGEEGRAIVEEDLDQLAKEIEATHEVENQATSKRRKRRKRRRRQAQGTGRETQLKEDLAWLEKALGEMEKSLLGAKYTDLSDLEIDVAKYGSHPLQELLKPFMELRDRKLKVERDLYQLSDSTNNYEPNDVCDQELHAEDQCENSLEKQAQQGIEDVQELRETEVCRADQAADQECSNCALQATTEELQELVEKESENIEESEIQNAISKGKAETGLLKKVDTGPTNLQLRNAKENYGEGGKLKDNDQNSDEGLKECEDETLPANMKWMKEKSKEEGKDQKKIEKIHFHTQTVGNQTRERKMRRRKVCELCGAANTDEGFDLYWCAGCKKVRWGF